jgi:hypothetical protein
MKTFASIDLRKCGYPTRTATSWVVSTSSAFCTHSMTTSSIKPIVKLTQIVNPLTNPTNQATKKVLFTALPRQHNSIESDLHQQQSSSICQTNDQDQSMLQLREQQVKQMIAGKQQVKKTTTDPYPEPSSASMNKWKERHPSYQTYSIHYMASQRRILFLADINPSKRFEHFEAMCYKRQLAPTTAQTYWTTWLGVQKALSIPPSESDPRVTKLMKARAEAYPVQFPTAAVLSDMELLVITFQMAIPSVTAIAMAAFLLGQRISDMIQLGVNDLQWNDEFLMITVRRGKTVPAYSHPYTLWLRRYKYPSESLIELTTDATKKNRLYLFSDLNSDDERAKTLNIMREV